MAVPEAGELDYGLSSILPRTAIQSKTQGVEWTPIVPTGPQVSQKYYIGVRDINSSACITKRGGQAEAKVCHLSGKNEGRDRRQGSDVEVGDGCVGLTTPLTVPLPTHL